MKLKIRQLVIILTVIALAVPLAAHAAVVGRFTQVRGQVELLKQGKLPAVPAKLQDGVEPGDVIRTKSGAKAQLTMVDDSIITLAPMSRLAVADYQYHPARVERRAVVRIFRGLVHTVVKRIINREEPDFIIETHTAVVGVRGTNWYTLLAPAFTSVYLVQGILGVSSNLPTIPARLLLETGQFTQIPLGKQPLLPKPLTPEMIKILEKMMDTGVTPGDLYLGPGPAKGAEFPMQLPVSPEQMLRLQTIPPKVVPTPQLAPPAPPPTPAPTPSSPGIRAY
jgi:hypothetical protein